MCVFTVIVLGTLIYLVSSVLTWFKEVVFWGKWCVCDASFLRRRRENNKTFWIQLHLTVSLVWALAVITGAYHGVDGGLSLPFLQGFLGLLPAADLLWRQAQQPAHLLPEEATVAIVNRPVVREDLHSRHLVALQRKTSTISWSTFKDLPCVLSEIMNITFWLNKK